MHRFKFPDQQKVDELVSILMITWTSYTEITITSSDESLLKQQPLDQAEFISAINAVSWELIPNDAVDTKKIEEDLFTTVECCMSNSNGCCSLRECGIFRIASHTEKMICEKNPRVSTCKLLTRH